MPPREPTALLTDALAQVDDLLVKADACDLEQLLADRVLWDTVVEDLPVMRASIQLLLARDSAG
jgi:uncharacterized protein with HEPN domain